MADVASGNPALALLLNWSVLTCLAVAGQRFQFRLPASYYDHRSFERSGRVYEIVGVRLFWHVMRSAPFSSLNPELRRNRRRTRADLDQLDQQMRQAESSHVYAFAIMIVVAAMVGGISSTATAGWILGISILINGYPVILQRYNRLRLNRVTRRSAGRIGVPSTPRQKKQGAHELSREAECEKLRRS